MILCICLHKILNKRVKKGNLGKYISVIELMDQRKKRSSMLEESQVDFTILQATKCPVLVLVDKSSCNFCFIKLMNDFFSANSLHLPDRCLLDAAPKVPLLATYGVDNFIVTIDPSTSSQNQYQLMQEEVYSAMALAPDGSHALFVSGGGIVKYDFESKTIASMIEQAGHGQVKTVKYSPSGAFVAIGAEDGKPLIYEPVTGRRDKCRPGHSQAVANIFISSDEQFIGSIGLDQNALIYRLSSSGEPQEVCRFQVSHLQDCGRLCGCFHSARSWAFLPGERYLQTFQLLDSRWQLVKMEGISHGENVIYLTQVVKENTLVTSSEKEVCVWNIRSQQKLFEIEQFSLSCVVPISGTFFGVKDDGVLYQYKRELKEHEPMEIQEEKPEDRIEFEEAGSEEEVEQLSDKKSEIEYHHYKKSKADKIISCLPQPPVTSSTSFFDGQRFLFVNEHGCVIERQEGDGETTVEVELGLENPKKIIIAHGREMPFFDLNPFALAYATEKEFGLKIQANIEGESWERPWNSIKNVAMGTGWLAVVNEEEIKILDMCCHEIRTIAFDREVLAVRAHENMLCVVYHESIPMWGAQQLSMQLILVDTSIRTTHLLSTVPVPIKPESILRSIHFSQEGMLISQDSTGALRAFSLERGDWTPISIVGLQDSRKAWVIGMVGHELLYWKTSNEDPEPTVGPRFAVKKSGFYIPTIGTYPGDTQEVYQQILWRRFVLDHEKARSRLWGRLKVSRPSGSVFAYLVNSIMSEKDIAQQHEELDEKYFSLVQTYLKAEEPIRAFYMARTCVRTIEASKKLIELFDYYNKRNLAIQLEEHCEQKEREIEYEQMQIFEFMKMREAAERTVKPRSEDPMKRGAKKITESIPSFSQNMSQDSLEHSAAKITTSQLSGISRPQGPSQNQEENPFLKKKSANEEFQAKKRQIQDHVERFSIKKKTEDRGMKRKKV